ncbi:MAG: type II toxin-antitoxin system Phd/YefM family antitoxin [Bdellovibrionaceae bacterium]|nr:type II toxin-antitoxin system Phd/YefM family antitoxin [Pseudobdellovibrionaceae bacterium]
MQLKPTQWLQFEDWILLSAILDSSRTPDSQAKISLQEVLMKALKISKDVVTLAEFKSQAASLLERIGSSSQPLLITQNGKPAGVLLSPAEFDRIQEQESSRFVISVNRGLQDADSGLETNFKNLDYDY